MHDKIIEVVQIDNLLLVSVAFNWGDGEYSEDKIFVDMKYDRFLSRTNWTNR
jgi:hypothetical protein